VATAAAFLLFGDQVEQRLTLGGDGGGVFDLKAGDGVITLSATRVTIIAARSRGHRRPRRTRTGRDYGWRLAQQLACRSGPPRGLPQHAGRAEPDLRARKV
jgi:hypothetical protein